MNLIINMRDAVHEACSRDGYSRPESSQFYCRCPVCALLAHENVILLFWTMTLTLAVTSGCSLTSQIAEPIS